VPLHFGVFMNSLRQKDAALAPYLAQLNDIDMQVAELEAGFVLW